MAGFRHSPEARDGASHQFRGRIIRTTMAIAAAVPLSFAGIHDVSWNAGHPTAAPAVARAADYGQLPTSFEANVGQADSRYGYVARAGGHTVYLSPTGMTFALSHTQQPVTGALLRSGPVAARSAAVRQTAAVQVSLAGANAAAAGAGQTTLPGVVNYFTGKDTSKWHTNIPTYSQVRYNGVYPGVDLIYHGNQGHLEYDFAVAPGADASVIHLQVDGANSISLDAQGSMVLHTALGDVVQQVPQASQDSGGVHSNVAAHYALAGGNQVSFVLGAYDKSKALVIDPLLSYSTYLGGSGDDQAVTIAVDATGAAYITGITASVDFPQASNSNQGNVDGFVTKISPDGQSIVYSTYVGGSGQDLPLGIAVDSGGNAYITGATTSFDFPTQPPGAAIGPLGTINAFVAKLAPNGASLSYSTLLGGSNGQIAVGLKIDGAGNAYITGETTSVDYPVSATALQKTYHSTPTGGNAFISKLNPAGNAFVYSTYLGGGGTDAGFGIAVASNGNAYIAGQTSSGSGVTAPLPTTLFAAQPSYGGGNSDAFVAGINPTGSSLIYLTYLGGSGDETQEFSDIAIDRFNNAYVTGGTTSTNGPFATLLAPSVAGGEDAYVTRVNSTGTAFIYSKRFGGSADDQGVSIAVDGLSNAYLTGETVSADGAFSSVLGVGGVAVGPPAVHDAYLVKVNPSGTALALNQRMGGTADDVAIGVALDTAPTPNIYVTGYTSSANFPTFNALQASNAGGTSGFDGFVIKFGTSPIPPPAAAPTVVTSFSPASIATGGSSQLTFAVTNPNVSSSLSNISFTDTVVPQLSVPNGPLTSTCSGSANAAANTITVTGVNLSAGASCNLTVNVSSSTVGTWNNTTGIVSSTEASGGTSNTASLTVTSGPPPPPPGCAVNAFLLTGSQQRQLTVFINVLGHPSNSIDYSDGISSFHVQASDIDANVICNSNNVFHAPIATITGHLTSAGGPLFNTGDHFAITIIHRPSGVPFAQVQDTTMAYNRSQNMPDEPASFATITF